MIDAAWIPLFSSTAGAAAALGGLIIVAMSVNIRAIIDAPSMPSRAGSTIASLVLVLVVSVAALIPNQSAWALGTEVLVFSAATLVLHADETRQFLKTKAGLGVTLGRMLVGVVPPIPFVVGGILLVAGSEAGLGWVAGGILLVFIGAVVNAWVLLVEILR